MESSLGRVGTVGAMEVDDFIQKLKLAMSQLAGPISIPETSVEQCVASVPPAHSELPPSPVVGSGSASVSMSQKSDVPTAFGGERSTRSKDGGGYHIWQTW